MPVCRFCAMALRSTIVAISIVGVVSVQAADQPQYENGEIKIPAAKADEAKLEKVSVSKALSYLEQGSLAWSAQRKCVSCHTNGIYMTVMPALSASLGKPSEATREFFLETLKTMSAEPKVKLRQSTKPAQVIYLAAGLAEWDASVTKQLSAETDQALFIKSG